YAGETVNSLEPISAAEAAGAYNLIDHGKEVGSAITRSQEVVLAKDGKLSGALEGSWTAGEGNAAEITIGKKTYKGFFVWQWNESLARYDIAFTLVAEDGTSIWGARR
ncbi:MAG: arabinanase, partial [Clostridia bacterium]|nr:arabinanase [Clostridia bacterium]